MRKFFIIGFAFIIICSTIVNCYVMASSSGLDFDIRYVVVWGRAQYYRGENITLGAVVYNIGNQTFRMSGRFEVLSPTNKVYHVTGEASYEFLDPGQMGTLEGNWTIPFDAETGWYKIKAVITAVADGESLTKSKEETCFKVIEPSGVDLISEIYIDGVLVSPWPNLQYPYTWEKKQDATIEYVIRNVGTCDAGPFWARYRYVDTGTGPPSPNDIDEAVRYSGLAAGGVIKKTHRIYDLRIGTRKGAWMLVDYMGEVDEANETNNDVTVFHTVVENLEAKLWVSSSSINFGSMKPYMECCLSLEIKNIGSGIMVWGVNENLDWITIEPTRGNATIETDEVLIKCSTEGLKPGKYQGYISLISNGGGKNVYVELEVTAVGYAIIVVGTSRNPIFGYDTIFDFTNNAGNHAFLVLLKLGFTKDDIFYLNPRIDQDVDGDGNSTNDIDAISNLANFDFAMQLAKQKVNSNVPLILYLVDHGYDDGFCLNENTDLTAGSLSSYINDIRLSTGCNDIIIIIDACQSGSFIDNLSAQGTIVITSTSSDQFAYFPGLSVFSAPFWVSISAQSSLGEAFNFASSKLGIWGLAQTPLLEDNNDGKGHPAAVPNGGDGILAMSTYIGFSVPTGFVPPPYIKSLVSSRKVSRESETTIWCTIKSYGKVTNVTAIIIPPGVSYLSEDLRELDRVSLTDPDGDGNYTATFTPTKLGDNKVVFFVIDNYGNVVVEKTLLKVVEKYSYQISIEKQLFEVFIEANSSVTDFTFNVIEKRLSFNVEGPDDTSGFCNLTIPKSLMKGPWQIEMDGNPLTPSIEYENSTHSFICIKYAHTTHQISITAAWVVPEFQSNEALLAFFVLVTVAFAFKRRRAAN
jgi:hypothetical protein